MKELRFGVHVLERSGHHEWVALARQVENSGFAILTVPDAPWLFRADRISDPVVTYRTFVARPSQLVTGICPDAQVAVDS